MDVFGAIWGWILTHWTNIVTTVTDVKIFADTVDSIKKLAPPKLEAKEAAQEYMTQTMDMVKDKSKDFEEKQLEADARKEFVGDMIELTAIEAKYNIARYAIFTAFTAFTFHTLMRVLMRQKSVR